MELYPHPHYAFMAWCSVEAKGLHIYLLLLLLLLMMITMIISPPPTESEVSKFSTVTIKTHYRGNQIMERESSFRITGVRRSNLGQESSHINGHVSCIV